MKRLVLAAFALTACHSADVKVEIVEPDVPNLFTNVATTQLLVQRNDSTIAVSSAHAATGSIDLSNVSYGADTVFRLEGTSKNGDTVAHGKTCPAPFTKSSRTIPLYFAPINYFGTTASLPVVDRIGAAAGLLDEGTVLVAGGTTAAGAPVSTSDVYTAGFTTFAVGPTLTTIRAYAVGVSIPGVGFVATGGVGASGAAIESSDLYIASTGNFETATATDARYEHQSVLLASGAVLSIGGRGSLTASSALASSEELFAFSDGSYSDVAGPTLTTARYGHAAVVAGENVYVVGGNDLTGKPLASIELCNDFSSTGNCTPISSGLMTARAYATASVTSDGSILVAGGVDELGVASDRAELYNRDARTVTEIQMVTARYKHTATVLADGTILIAGGLDATNAPTASVELYNANGDFVAVGNNLTAARNGHIAVTSCDDTVLFAGGNAGSGAEVFTPAAYSAQ